MFSPVRTVAAMQVLVWLLGILVFVTPWAFQWRTVQGLPEPVGDTLWSISAWYSIALMVCALAIVYCGVRMKSKDWPAIGLSLLGLIVVSMCIEAHNLPNASIYASDSWNYAIGLKIGIGAGAAVLVCGVILGVLGTVKSRRRD